MKNMRKKDFMSEATKHVKLTKIQYVRYKEEVQSDTDIIDSLSKKIGHLETKSINKLLEDLDLGIIMSRYLSYKELDEYYRSRQKLTELLQKIVKAI